MPDGLPGDQYLLFRGEAFIGRLHTEEYDFPWIRGTFEPAGDFESVRALFEAERRFRDSSNLDGDHPDFAEWWDAWQELYTPPLRVLTPESGRASDLDDWVVYLDGSKVRWCPTKFQN